jgi:hypothetical protein
VNKKYLLLLVKKGELKKYIEFDKAKKRSRQEKKKIKNVLKKSINKLPTQNKKLQTAKCANAPLEASP